MRKVDRSSVPFPNRLLQQNLTEDNLAHLENYKQINSSIYSHQDVKNSLKMLYFDKCYICEGDISSGDYDVEHYLPKRHFPATRLHLAKSSQSVYWLQSGKRE